MKALTTEQQNFGRQCRQPISRYKTMKNRIVCRDTKVCVEPTKARYACGCYPLSFDRCYRLAA